MDRNGDIATHYGVNKLEGVPALLFALSDARHMTPQALADWLAQWSWSSHRIRLDNAIETSSIMPCC